MYVNKIGIRLPSMEAMRYGGDDNPESWYLYNEETGMAYELWVTPSDEYVLGAYHDDVGLVTWYDIDLEYWEKLETDISNIVIEDDNHDEEDI